MKLAALATAALLLTGCASGPLCGGVPYLGAWMVDEETDHAVHHWCIAGGERFVLEVVASRTPDGTRVAEWTPLATLDVSLARGESTMFGFECGSRDGTRGDIITVVRRQGEDSFVVKRAWSIDIASRRFVPVSPEMVVCESIGE